MSNTIKCISLWNPWATLIAIGAKRIETRGWDARFTGDIAIHASQRAVNSVLAKEPFKSVLKDARRLPIECRHRGAIVAVCRIDRVASIIGGATAGYLDDGTVVEGNEWNFGDYSAGRFAWMLSNIRPLKNPVPFKGRQKWFNVPLELIAHEIGEALPEQAGAR